MPRSKNLKKNQKTTTLDNKIFELLAKVKE